MAKTIKEEDLRLNIIVNGDAGRKQILDLEYSVTQLTEKVKKQKAELKDLEEQGKKDSQEYRNLAMQLGKNDKALESNKARLESLRRQQSGKGGDFPAIPSPGTKLSGFPSYLRDLIHFFLSL